MSTLSYSLHLGSDKNRKPSSRNMAKNNASGSTSLSNNAIQNARGLSRVDKHNYRKYDNNTELIEIIRGTSSLYNDVKMKEYDIGVLYVVKDDGTLLEDNEALFKYIPDKTDGVITREEMVSGVSFAKVKPANEIGLEECTVYEEE